MQPTSQRQHNVLAVVALAAAIAATMLFFTLQTAAAKGSQEMQQDYQPAHNGGEDGEGAKGDKNKVVGSVLTTPSTGFIGDWVVLEARSAVTVVVTAQTEVSDFDGVPPAAGVWVEAKGQRQPDGTLLAKRLRPNEFEAGELVVRLTSSAVLTDVLTEPRYQKYKLSELASLLASAAIYRLNIGEEGKEEEAAGALQSDPNVKWAEVNYVSEIPSDPQGDPYRTWKWGSSDASGYINQTAFQQVNLAPAHAYYRGDGVTVAVLDTGIDAGHPVFAGRLLPGRDLVNDDTIPQDGPEAGQAGGAAEGHGTHVSGIIAQVAPHSTLLPIRVLDVDGRGSTYILAYAIEWAVDNHADVINLSLGSDFDSNVLADAIAQAQQRGVLIVAAAGNDNAETPQYPAAYPGVIGVTAVDAGNHKADFANYGESWVDLAAPGVGITSTVPVSLSILYATWSGTSMSTPFVTGAAALARQKLPAASPAELAQMLVDTGTDPNQLNHEYAGKLGRLLNIGAALVPSQPVADAKLYLPVLLTQR